MVARLVMVLALLGMGLLGVVGCGQPDAGDGTSAAVDAAEVTVTPEMSDILAKADALDGETDKVVTLCASCSLGMDGLAEHSLEVGEYTMYFCKDYCKQRFSKNITESVLKMKIPQEGDADHHH
jgi:YHS domain-containing protein